MLSARFVSSSQSSVCLRGPCFSGWTSGRTSFHWNHQQSFLGWSLRNTDPGNREQVTSAQWTDLKHTANRVWRDMTPDMKHKHSAKTGRNQRNLPGQQPSPCLSTYEYSCCSEPPPRCHKTLPPSYPDRSLCNLLWEKTQTNTNFTCLEFAENMISRFILTPRGSSGCSSGCYSNIFY